MKLFVVAAALHSLATCTLVAGHGFMVIPPARNNHNNVNPNATGNNHMNAGPCSGGACLWFSEGCFVGCKACSATMPKGGNQVDSPNCTGFVDRQPTLPEEFRTYNVHNLSGNGDWTRFHPWRSPGLAPVADPCGVAGAYLKPTGGGGETPPGAKQGDRGSLLPPLQGVHTEWVAGESTEVGWMVAANHGGGYHYSVCPKSSPLTEACLDAHSLEFVGTNHTIRYLDSRPDIQIAARDVNVGTFPAGSTWRVNPIPACNCDWGRGCSTSKNRSPTSPSRAYYNGTPPADPVVKGKEQCNTGTQFPYPFPYAYGQQMWNHVDGIAGDNWAMVDHVRAPAEAGDYVLRWRWDTEQNPQVWTHCADITVKA